jgi:RNA polymerase sigma factor (sigma-70 family)
LSGDAIMAKRKFKDPYDVREAYKSEKGRSPYWEWCQRHCPADEDGRLIEPRGGNPAQFPEPAEQDQSDELKAVIEVLNEGGLDKLTVRQRRAFRLVAIQGLTYREAASRMGISAETVYEHVKAAGAKLKKLCEDKI